jgi:hypothetical protein
MMARGSRDPDRYRLPRNQPTPSLLIGGTLVLVFGLGCVRSGYPPDWSRDDSTVQSDPSEKRRT